MLDKARDLQAPHAWFLSMRVAEVGVLVLLVGALLEARTAWQVGAQYTGDASLGSGAPQISLMQRFIGMALFGGYRGLVSMLVVALALGGLLVVLHRCQPVSHTRVLRWEWLSLWAVSTLLALVSSAVGVVALFGDSPYDSPDTSVSDDSFGPSYHEQVVTNLSWPLGALLLLLPLGLWWARLPDMDDLEDALTGLEQATPRASRPPAAGAEPAGGGVQTDGAAAPAGGALAGDVVRGHRDGWRGPAIDDDSIFVDDVEQIDPVERLAPRGPEGGDGSSSSGYEGYFRRP